MFKRIGIDEQTVSTWIAGAVARAITNPLDIVKIRQQVGGRHDQKGTLMTLMSLMNDDGTMAWFKGYLVNVIKQIPYDIAYAVTTDYAKDWLIPFGLSSETVEVMLAIEGSMIANALTYPLETIRTRLVVQETKDNEKYEGIVDTLNTIITEEGYLALFKGVEATMLGVIPFELGMHFVRKAVGWYFPEDTWKLLKVSLATIIAKTLAYPFELVSRKMQAQSPFVAAENNPDVQFTGMRSCFQAIVNKHGVPGLWTGNVANLLKIVSFHPLVYGLHTMIKPTLSDLSRELRERQILY